MKFRTVALIVLPVRTRVAPRAISADSSNTTECTSHRARMPSTTAAKPASAVTPAEPEAISCATSSAPPLCEEPAADKRSATRFNVCS